MHGTFVYFIGRELRRLRFRDCPDVSAARVALEDMLQVPVKFQAAST